MAAKNPLARLSAVDITRTSFTCLRAQSPALAGSCGIVRDQRERHRALRHVLEIVLVVLVRYERCTVHIFVSGKPSTVKGRERERERKQITSKDVVKFDNRMSGNKCRRAAS